MIGIKTEKINVTPRSMPQESKSIKVERLDLKPKRIITKATKEPTTAMASAIADKFPWTMDSIADELGMPVASFRAWKQKAEKDGKIVKPKIGSLLCIVDPAIKTRLRFSDAYVDKLKALRGGVKPRKESSPSALQHAKLKVLVPVFDDVVAKFLISKFGDEKGVEEYLKKHLIEMAKPAMAKLEELKKKYEEEMASVLGSL